MNNLKRSKLIIVSGKNPAMAKSGYASYASALARELTRQKFEVHIFSVGDRKSISKTSTGTIHVVKVPFIQSVAGREMVALLPCSIILSGEIKHFIYENNVQLVWGIGPWTLAGVLALIRQKKAKLLADYFTTIKHEYSHLPVSFEAFLAKIILIPLYSLLEKYLLIKSNLIITHYRSTEEILTKQFNKTFYFRRIPVILPESDLSINIPQPGFRRLPHIITICRQDFRKGISYLLKAYALLNESGLKYSAVIAGGGSDLEKNRQLARRLKLSNIRFLGYVDDLDKIVSSADIFVLPTLEEGSGSLAVLEAMKAGLPIISTNVDGIPEDLNNDRTAILVPPAHPGALAAALEKLLKNPKLATGLGLSAKITYQEKYSAIKVRSAVQKILKSFEREQLP